MKNIAAHDIAVALRPLGFEMQSDRNGVKFVRPNATTADLFERLECVYVGRPSDMRFSSGLWTGKTIVLSVSLSVVRHAALQLRGLVTGDGWPEVSTDPERHEVTFQDRREINAWLTHLADRAPERFERLVREKGDTLLAETKKAREWAATIADTIVARRGLADALREPLADLTREETKLANALMKLPFAVPSQEEDVSGVAIAALIRSGDDVVASLGRALQTVSTPTVVDTIEWLKTSVPDDDLIWRIRLLVDRILMWRDASLITT
jgi:hypothetical protein